MVEMCLGYREESRLLMGLGTKHAALTYPAMGHAVVMLLVMENGPCLEKVMWHLVVDHFQVEAESVNFNGIQRMLQSFLCLSY